MAEIARRAGVVRATIYAHFPTRESLLDAVMEHAIAQVAEAIREAEPERGEPKEALERVLLATWQQLSQFHSVLAININRLSTKELHRRHLPMTIQTIRLGPRNGQGSHGALHRDQGGSGQALTSRLLPAGKGIAGAHLAGLKAAVEPRYPLL